MATRHTDQPARTPSFLPDAYLPGPAARTTGPALRPGPGLQARRQPPRRAGARSPPWPPTELRRVSLDLSGLRAAQVHVNGAKVARFTQKAGKLELHLSSPVPAGEQFTVEVRYSGNPGVRQGDLGRGRLGGTDRRGARGRPAQRGPHLVPLQRPPQPEGDLPHRDRHRRRLPPGGQRQAGRQAPAGHPRDLDLRGRRADGQLPGHPADRPLRARALDGAVAAGSRGGARRFPARRPPGSPRAPGSCRPRGPRWRTSRG